MGTGVMVENLRPNSFLTSESQVRSLDFDYIAQAEHVMKSVIEPLPNTQDYLQAQQLQHLIKVRREGQYVRCCVPTEYLFDSDGTMNADRELLLDQIREDIRDMNFAAIEVRANLESEDRFEATNLASDVVIALLHNGQENSIDPSSIYSIGFGDKDARGNYMVDPYASSRVVLPRMERVGTLEFRLYYEEP